MYFDHLEPEDSSNYTCVASNSGGTSREIGMVIVECKWILSLEKVLLDPIFILKWINFDSLWIVFWNSSWRFGFSTRSVGHVMFSFVGTAQEAVAVYIKKKPHQWTTNKDTNCPDLPPAPASWAVPANENITHVFKTTRCEAETAWIVSKYDPKSTLILLKIITFWQS